MAKSAAAVAPVVAGVESSNAPRKVTRSKNFWRALNLFERVTLGPLAPQVTTPHDIVWMWEHSTLYRYDRPRIPLRYRIPVLIVPPLMVKPTIFDLRPGHSMVGYFRARGFNTFLVDFGTPKEEDAFIGVDHYVTDFIPHAVAKTMELTAAPAVSLVGWSMGGIMSYTYVARYGQDAGVRNIVTIGSPFDFSQMFPFNQMARLIELPGARKVLQSIGNIPPWMTAGSFKLMDPLKLVRRNFDLLSHYWDREWVAAYESISKWADEFVPYPQEAFRQFVTDYVATDKLRQGDLSIGGKPVDTRRIQSNVLVVAGTSDKIAPQASVEAAAELLKNSPDRSVLRAPLGHIGLVAGGGAPKYVWEPIADWLAERSG